MPDETLRCVDCDQTFIFPEGDQEFYKDRGFLPPKRCLTCRKKKKARYEERERQQREGGSTE